MRGRKQALENRLTESKGVRVGDKVRLCGVAMPDDVGTVERIAKQKFYRKEEEYTEEVFGVLVNGESWYPISRTELKLAEAENLVLI